MREAFDRVKSQIGTCGIWCGSCAVGNGSMRELARRFHNLLESHGVGRWAPSELDYDAFSAGLGTIDEIASCPGCRAFGGRNDCEMRTCATARGLTECIDCSDTASCSHKDLLDHMRSGAQNAGLYVRTAETAPHDLISRWTVQLKTQWPSRILFDDDLASGT
jgi:hypothetical protein